MKERPILFSGPMVRAILDGRKTQTRRVVKCRMPHDQIIDMCQFKGADGNSTGEFGLCLHERVISEHIWCPYGAPGDRLWVRETHYVQSAGYTDGSGKLILYRADGDAPTTWTPSIHMPRWASRITLEVTKVRFERIQNISAADAVAEGCESCTPYDQFRALWTFIHTADGQNGWSAHKWVWVVGFRRVDGAN